MGLALFHRNGWSALGIDGLVDQEPRLLLHPRFLHQAHSPCEGHLARVHRALHGRTPHWLSVHVEAEGAQVAPGERLEVND